MNIYKITFSYRAPNGLMRSNNLIMEATNELAARERALTELTHSASYRYPLITKVTLYGDQGQLDLKQTKETKTR